MTLSVAPVTDRPRTPYRDPERRFRLRPLHGLIIVVFGVALFLPAVGSRVTLSRHEVLAAQPAREMVRFGHWIIPTFAGKPRLVKPPTTGWLIALFMEVTGSQSETVVRMPSLISAALLALIIASLAARFGGTWAGLVAGLCQLTFYYILMQGRLAEADMPMATCVAMSIYCFAVACVDGPRPPRPSWGLQLGFHFFAAAAFCFKGPIGPGFIYPACVMYLLLRRQRRGWSFIFGPGLLVFFIVSAAWPLAAYHEYPSITSVWRDETFGRAVGDLTGEEYHAWWFYFPMIIMMMVPWLPWTIIGIRLAGYYRLLRSPLATLLLSWFVPGLIILSLIAWKHKHYAIPIMPALTLPTAAGLLWWLHELRHSRTIGIGAAAMFFVSGCGSAVLFVHSYTPAGKAQITALIGVLAVGGLIVLWMSARRSLKGQLAAFFGTAYVVCVAAQLWVMPYYDVYAPWTALARQAAAAIPPGQTTYLLGLYEAQAAFFLNFPMQRCDTPDEIQQTFGSLHHDAYALTPASIIPQLQQLGKVTPILEGDVKLILPNKAQDAIWLIHFEPVRGGFALLGSPPLTSRSQGRPAPWQ